MKRKAIAKKAARARWQKELGGERFVVREIISKVEDHYQLFPTLVVELIVAIDVSLQLTAISDNLLATQLKSPLHVARASGPDILPDGNLLIIPLDKGNMLGPDASSPTVRDVMLTQCLGEVLGALLDK
ncbi:MAG TPA: hypothetical protein VH639_14970 [Bryobacteraceae bacterium]